MNLHDAVHRVVDDYFSITGRPVSTMSVDEYLKLCEFASSNVNLMASGMDSEREESYHSTESVPGISRVHDSYETAENSHITLPSSCQKAEMHEVIPMYASNPDIATGNVNEQPKASREDMLKLLQSVDS